jgi:hypothetical protein
MYNSQTLTELFNRLRGNMPDEALKNLILNRSTIQTPLAHVQGMPYLAIYPEHSGR